jgi:hypothetical protein
METSEDILRQIENSTRGIPDHKGEEEASFEQEGDSSTIPDDPVYTYLEQKTEREALVERWKTEEPQRIQEEYERTGVIPPYKPFEQWVQEQAEPIPQQEVLQRAILEDIEDLQTRYPKSSANFLKKLRRGEIQLPEELEAEDNALEQMFINSISEDEFRRMHVDAQLELFKKEDEERRPLRTRSLDVAMPQRVRPKPQPRRQSTYTMPELTQDELREALTWAIQKKMGGGR